MAFTQVFNESNGTELKDHKPIRVHAQVSKPAPPGRASGRKRSQRGFSLILLSLAPVVLLGMAGLAIDLSRMFIYKNELQTFADASAMGAIAKMDGTQTGI